MASGECAPDWSLQKINKRADEEQHVDDFENPRRHAEELRLFGVSAMFFAGMRRFVRDLLAAVRDVSRIRRLRVKQRGNAQ